MSITQDNQNYIFMDGDEIVIGIKPYIGAKEYIYQKEITDLTGKEILDIEILPEETRKMPQGEAVFEITLINGNFEKTLYQDEISIMGVVNKERN